MISLVAPVGARSTFPLLQNNIERVTGRTSGMLSKSQKVASCFSTHHDAIVPYETTIHGVMKAFSVDACDQLRLPGNINDGRGILKFFRRVAEYPKRPDATEEIPF